MNCYFTCFRNVYIFDPIITIELQFDPTYELRKGRISDLSL